MNAVETLSQHLIPAAMVSARVAGLAVQGPVLSSPAIPMRIKALLVLALGLAVYPSVAQHAALPAADTTLAMAAPLLLVEFAIGVFIGFMASMPLLAAQFGGLAMGQQIGLGFARFYNPAVGDESDVLEQLMFFLALATFIALGGIESMFSSVVASFASLPAGAIPALVTGASDTSPVAVFTGAMTGAFELGLRVAAPLLAIVCLETVVMGYLSKSVPQLNVMSIGFPLRIIVGLGVIVVSLAAIDEAIIDGTSGAIEELLIATGAVAEGGPHG
ncbi:MAG: putative flagellar biosynthetic protein FliR [Planctomycetota bacterium]|jgi:flagellar biosynthetic protein FliR